MNKAETLEYITCDVCGARVKIYYNWVTGHYEGECACCRKWYEGYK